jgi:uncharacterized protein with beta-barrel porin domain
VAKFSAQSYGGRVEAGYRFAAASVGIAPYAAANAQAFVTPAYSESDAGGGGFGLASDAGGAGDVPPPRG